MTVLRTSERIAAAEVRINHPRLNSVLKVELSDRSGITRYVRQQTRHVLDANVNVIRIF